VTTRLMRRVSPVLAVSVVAVGVAFAAPSAGTVTVKATLNSGLGSKVIVSSAGLTLYHYTDEKKGKIDCTGACAIAWPPLVVPAKAKPLAGPGLLASKLGTLKRPDGKMQVTYNGLALYRYAADKKAGQANGQGEGGAWYAVTAAGSVTKKPLAAATTSGSGSSGSTAGTGGSTGNTAAGGAGAGGGAAPANAACNGAIITDPASPCYNY
jgi:predicted lipoprotein with Yx(FWY)xxD motif